MVTSRELLGVVPDKAGLIEKGMKYGKYFSRKFVLPLSVTAKEYFAYRLISSDVAEMCGPSMKEGE